MKTKTVVASLALGSLLTLSGCATNPFAANTMDDGYQNIQKTQEANCGNKKMADSTCGDTKMSNGSCGANKAVEGSCGDSKKADGSCAATKKVDSKCGDAKCGANN